MRGSFNETGYAKKVSGLPTMNIYDSIESTQNKMAIQGCVNNSFGLFASPSVPLFSAVRSEFVGKIIAYIFSPNTLYLVRLEASRTKIFLSVSSINLLSQLYLVLWT